MTDNITKLPVHPKPREARCTGSVPSDNLRNAQSHTLASMGLDASVWPHSSDYAKMVRKVRDEARAMCVALDSLARHCAEIDRELTALLGEDTTPGGAA